MKSFYLFVLSTLFSINLYATQMCPENVYAHNGHFEDKDVPSGWHITEVSLNPDDPDVTKDPNLKLRFSIADYNRFTQNKILEMLGLKKIPLKGNDQKISCWYSFNDSHIVITTNQGNIKNPVQPGTNWEAFGTERAVCDLFTTEEKKITDCPWE